MPGIHTIIHDTKMHGAVIPPDLGHTLFSDNFRVVPCIESPACFSAVSCYDGYPFFTFDCETTRVVVEGMVYNRTELKVKELLKAIAVRFAEGEGFETLVKDFVATSDGDFLVQIWDESTQKFLLFNDIFGRLPVYYYAKNGKYIFSKDIMTILELIPAIVLDVKGMAEFLMLEYPLGEQTMFCDIRYLLPGSMAVVKTGRPRAFFEVMPTDRFCYDLRDPFLTSEDSIGYLNKSFLEATRDRVSALEAKGYRLIADLSGGYDTRTVLAGLSRFDKKVSYHTFEYIRDESAYAKKIFEAMDSPGSWRKLVIGSGTIPSDELSSLVFRTDGLVNHYTTDICWREMESLRQTRPGIVARISGLAGEFIRHPLKNRGKSLFEGFAAGYYSPVSLDDALAALKVSIPGRSRFRHELEQYFADYPEQTQDGKLKRFYYEYYNRYVSVAGEERERIHFWTVQPLWGLSFMKAVASRVPLAWPSFSYYIRFMESLDSRLSSVPIYGSWINLRSKLNIRAYDFFAKVKASRITAFIKKRLPLLAVLYRRKTPDKRQIEASCWLLDNITERSAAARELFDITAAKNIFFKEEHDADRIITLAMYAAELESRFGAKLSINNV